MAINLKKSLNLNYLDLTNLTHKYGKYDLPSMSCPNIMNIDYIALYGQPQDYLKTKNTIVSFYQYDNQFDGINGLFNAIYYNEQKLLSKYKERFKKCKIFISPDYSQCGDLERIENIYRIFKARIVSLWLTIEIGAIVIPNITYSSQDSLEYIFDGLEDCKTVAFSTKGSLQKEYAKGLLATSIKRAVDRLNIETIIVYSVSIDDQKILNLFKYAIDRNIRIIIPNNSLRERNIERSGNKNGKI